MASKGTHGSYIDVTIMGVLDGSFLAASADKIYVFGDAKIGKEDYCFADDEKASRHIGTKVSISSWDFSFDKKKLKKLIKEIK